MASLFDLPGFNWDFIDPAISDFFSMLSPVDQSLQSLDAPELGVPGASAPVGAPAGGLPSLGGQQKPPLSTGVDPTQNFQGQPQQGNPGAALMMALLKMQQAKRGGGGF